MSGLAATLGANAPAAAAIADALLARGQDLASWQAGGAHLVVRAAMPAVYEFPNGALLLDGDAAPSALAAAYTDRGPAGLVSADPAADAASYAVVLADLARDALVLARQGDGPPLYWARRGRAVLVGSEPVALLAAGVPAEPDPATVARFLATGACDDGPATFFSGVRRVLPGQVVEMVARDGAVTAIRVHAEPTGRLATGAADSRGPAPIDAALALDQAVDLTGRIGVRVGCSVGAAAVLGAVLDRPERPRPLPVYSTSFPELATTDRSAYCTAALLGPYALGAARHRALPFFADEIDLDPFLLDLGEPTPALDDWLLWAITRRVAGEVDTLVDAAAGSQLGRLADRVASRFGVSLRLPLRDLPAGAHRSELAAAVERLLPGSSARFADAAASEPGPHALLAALLRRMRTELVTTFLEPRGTSGGLADTLALVSGDRVDAASLWRRYVVERWLRCVVEPAAGAAPEPVTVGTPGPVTVAGRRFERRPVRTEPLAAGDKLPEKLAWYVGEATQQAAGTWGQLGGGRWAGDNWYVLLAAKPVAVMQGRARNLWDIRPGLTARVLHRLAGQVGAAGGPRRPGCGLASPWAMQVALDERSGAGRGGGWGPMLGAVAGAAIGQVGWYERLAGPAVRAIRPPRPDAVPPGQVSVVPAPVEPDRVASDVVAALRTALPDRWYASLGGCAVVSAASAGTVLGWAGRPGVAPPPAGLLASLSADDPFGDDHTPIVVALPNGTGNGDDPGE